MIALCRAFLTWLIEGSDVPCLDPAWLSNKERLAQYEAFTANQLHSCVVKDVAATNRERFWQWKLDQRLAESLVVKGAFGKVKRA